MNLGVNDTGPVRASAASLTGPQDRSLNALGSVVLEKPFPFPLDLSVL